MLNIANAAAILICNNMTGEIEVEKKAHWHQSWMAKPHAKGRGEGKGEMATSGITSSMICYKFRVVEITKLIRFSGDFLPTPANPW